MTTFFTGDTHFGHQNIIGFCNRPFNFTEDMEEALVENWNARVTCEDTVYHLGDFCWKDQKCGKYVLSLLNGRKILIRGNHDKPMISDPQLWYSVTEKVHIILEGKQHLILFHYPMLSWPYLTHGAIHLHGHSHGNIPQMRNRIDVGVDCWDYRPVTWEEINAARPQFQPNDVKF